MWVLQCIWETERRRKPVYLEDNTHIGPMYTEELGKAKRFGTESCAVMDKAYTHPLACFEPAYIDE